MNARVNFLSEEKTGQVKSTPRVLVPKPAVVRLLLTTKTKALPSLTHDPHAASYATHERHLEKGVLLNGGAAAAD